MQKLLKSRIFLVIITFLITLSCTVYATTRYLASEIEYKETTVEGALNDLYTVHETYKNLNINTDFTANDLISGKTAYNSNGELVTGNLEHNCVNGTINKPASSQLNIYLDFVPKSFIIYMKNPLSDNLISSFEYNQLTKKVYAHHIDSNSQVTSNESSVFSISGNNIVSSFATNSSNGYYKASTTVYYTACK